MRYQCSYNVTERLTWEIYLDEYSFWSHIHFLKTTIMQVRPLSVSFCVLSWNLGMLEDTVIIQRKNTHQNFTTEPTKEVNHIITTEKKQHFSYNPAV